MHLLHRSTTNCFLRERKKVRNREVPRFPQILQLLLSFHLVLIRSPPAVLSCGTFYLAGGPAAAARTRQTERVLVSVFAAQRCRRSLPQRLGSGSKAAAAASCTCVLLFCTSPTPQSCPVHNILGSSFSDKQALQQQQRKRERKMFRCRREIESPNSAGTAGKRTEVAAFRVVAFLQLL